MTPSQGMGAQTAQTAQPTTSKWSGKSQLISLQAIASSPTKTTFKQANCRNSWKEQRSNRKNKENPRKKLRVKKNLEICRKIGFKWHLAREWEHRQHKQHSPRQASDPASPNSSVSKPLPVVQLKQLSNKKIAGTPGKSNVQIGRTKKILEKKLRVRKNWEISRKIGFKWHLAREWEHRQHKQHSPRQASDPASPNSSVSKPLPVVLLKQLSNKKIAGTPGKSNVQIGRTKKILEKKLRVRKTWEISRKIGFKLHLARECWDNVFTTFHPGMHIRLRKCTLCTDL